MCGTGVPDGVVLDPNIVADTYGCEDAGGGLFGGQMLAT